MSSQALWGEDGQGDGRLTQEALHEVTRHIYLHVAPDGVGAMSSPRNGTARVQADHSPVAAAGAR